MSDNPDNGMTEDEMISEDLLALLYPDDGAAPSVAAMGDLDELEDLRGLRSLFREMPDEDPSDAVSNRLLAMAAQHAPNKKQEGKGFFLWLSDLFLPMAYHPGLAAAASMVLVAGLVGTLYVNGKSQVAEPQVSSNAAAPASVTLEGTLDERAAASAGRSNQAEGEGAKEQAAAPTDSLQADSAADEAGYNAPAKAEARSKNDDSLFGGKSGQPATKTPTRLGDSFDTGVGGGGSAGPGAKIAEPKRRQAPTKPQSSIATGAGDLRKSADGALDFKSGESEVKPKPTPKQTAKGKGSARDQESTPDLNTTTTRADSAPAPPPPPPQNKDVKAPTEEPAASPDPERSVDKSSEPVDKSPEPVASEGEEADDEDASEEAPPPPDPVVESAKLHKQAVVAAKQGNCDKVKSIGQQIRKLSSAYYDRSFLSDEKLKACLAPAPKKKS